MLFGDFPNPDVIRVHDAYYMLSTTRFLFPGATIMRSYDLVNWEYCSNPVDCIEKDDVYSLKNGADRYNGGVQSASLQYNERDGKYTLSNPDAITISDGYIIAQNDGITTVEAISRLPSGIYIIGNRKVHIRK